MCALSPGEQCGLRPVRDAGRAARINPVLQAGGAAGPA